MVQGWGKQHDSKKTLASRAWPGLSWLQGEKDVVCVPDLGLGAGPVQLQPEHKPVMASGATASCSSSGQDPGWADTNQEP